MILRSTDIRGALRARQRGFFTMPGGMGAMRPAGGGGGGGGPELLLHFDGLRHAVHVEDSSGNGHTCAAVGSCAITDAVTLMSGGECMQFFPWNGSFTGHVKVDHFSALDTGSGDFTYRCKVRRAAPGSQPGIFSRRITGIVCPLELEFYSNTFQLLMGDASNTGWAAIHAFAGTTAIAADTVYDVELVKHGSSITLYVDGVPDANVLSLATMSTGSHDLYIGKGGNGALTGYVDEFEFYTYALHTSGFTPPTTPTAGATFTYPTPAGARRAWRVRTDSGLIALAAMSELELRTSLSGGTGIVETASSGTAIARSTYGGYSAADAFNGGFGARWASSAAYADEWIGYDMGSGNTLDPVEIAVSEGQFGQDFYRCYVDYSDDASTWTHYLTLPIGTSWPSGAFKVFVLP